MNFMKNKYYLILGIGSSLLSLIYLLINALQTSSFSILGFIFFLIGIFLFIYWSTISYSWKCSVCGESFKINLIQNFLGINSGINNKILYCAKCNKKTLCKGHLIK